MYSIADIEKLSGVKAHTIRIWEKRYNIIPGNRSDTNIRYYSEEDLQFILNVAFLNKNGLKISKIANLSPISIKQKVAECINAGAGEQAENVDSLFLAMYELNEHKFIKLINHKIVLDGFESTMQNTIYPFLDKLSLTWMSGSVKNIHENFVTSIIKRKVSVEIDRLDPVFDPSAEKILLYLPDNEEHELSLLYVNYLLRKAGVNVLYLGKQTPLIDIVESCQIYKPNYIFTIFNESHMGSHLQTYLDELFNYISDCQVIVAGYQTLKLNLTDHENLSVITDVTQVLDIIASNKLQTMKS